VRSRLDAETVVDGRYRVIKRLGSGGMADVYCAEDLQLGRQVALKVLYGRFAEDSEFVERFRREASSAAGLQHQHVVGVYDRGEWDGTYYIAMEFLDGRSLKQIVEEEGPLDPERAVDLTTQVLRAARRIWIVRSIARTESSGASAWMICLSVRPSTYSIAMYDVPFHSPRS